MNLGERVARYRKLNGWSAEALAERTGDPSITRDVIANIEYGRRKDIGVTQLWAIASALDVPLVALLAPIDQPDASVQIGSQTRSVLDVVIDSEAWELSPSAPPSAREARAQIAALRTYDRLRQAVARTIIYDAGPFAVISVDHERAQNSLDDHIATMRALGIEVHRDG